MAGPQILDTKHRRAAADFVEGVAALSASLKPGADPSTARAPWADSNFDAPRRLAWQHGWDWACVHPEARRQLLYLLTGKWGA